MDQSVLLRLSENLPKHCFRISDKIKEGINDLEVLDRVLIWRGASVLNKSQISPILPPVFS